MNPNPASRQSTHIHSTFNPPPQCLNAVNLVPNPQDIHAVIAIYYQQSDSKSLSCVPVEFPFRSSWNSLAVPRARSSTPPGHTHPRQRMTNLAADVRVFYHVTSRNWCFEKHARLLGSSTLSWPKWHRSCPLMARLRSCLASLRCTGRLRDMA